MAILNQRKASGKPDNDAAKTGALISLSKFVVGFFLKPETNALILTPVLGVAANPDFSFKWITLFQSPTVEAMTSAICECCVAFIIVMKPLAVASLVPDNGRMAGAISRRDSEFCYRLLNYRP